MAAGAQGNRLQDGDSPCVHVCLMDYAQGVCIGCCRTLDEITHWIDYSPERKQAVLAQLDARRSALESETRN